MDPILTALDRAFAGVDARSRELLALVRSDEIFIRPEETSRTMQTFSCGECILRSAAMVEKAFGGITTRLWDDPFEWTLPEELSTVADILRYLDEVESTRVRGFAFFRGDDDLKREMPAPQELRPIIDILSDALIKASHFQGRAYALFQVLSQKSPPRI